MEHSQQVGVNVDTTLVAIFRIVYRYVASIDLHNPAITSLVRRFLFPCYM